MFPRHKEFVMFLTSLLGVLFQSAENQAAIAAIVASLVFLVALVLPTIGITGGLKQLFDGVPDIHLGRITIKGGLWLSWLVGGGVSALAYFVGRISFDFTGDPNLDFAALWAIVSFSANLVRNTVYPPAPPTEPIEMANRAVSRSK